MTTDDGELLDAPLVPKIDHFLRDGHVTLVGYEGSGRRAHLRAACEALGLLPVDSGLDDTRRPQDRAVRVIDLGAWPPAPSRMPALVELLREARRSRPIAMLLASWEAVRTLEERLRETAPDEGSHLAVWSTHLISMTDVPRAALEAAVPAGPRRDRLLAWDEDLRGHRGLWRELLAWALLGGSLHQEDLSRPDAPFQRFGRRLGELGTNERTLARSGPSADTSTTDPSRALANLEASGALCARGQEQTRWAVRPLASRLLG